MFAARTSAVLVLALAAAATAVNLPSNVSTAYDVFPASAFAAAGASAWSDARLEDADKKGTPSQTVFAGGAAVPGLLDIEHNFNMRPPCSFVGPLHYHARGTETQLNVGPGNMWMFLIREDMSQAYFYRLPVYGMVGVPPGWLHSPIGGCNSTRSFTTFNSGDAGIVFAPLGHELRVDPAAIKLGNNATKEEAERVIGWMTALPGMNTFPIPYKKLSSENLTMAGCLEWCAKNGHRDW